MREDSSFYLLFLLLFYCFFYLFFLSYKMLLNGSNVTLNSITFAIHNMIDSAVIAVETNFELA